MNLSFLINRFLRNERIVDGYRYQFQPFGGGPDSEPYYRDIIFKKNHCLVDIGANAGGWTIPAARYYREIHAFEANPRIAKVLTSNLAKNRIRNVTVNPFALGDEQGQSSLWLYNGTGQDSLFKTHLGYTSTGEQILVETRRLDSFHLSPSIVKVDTEGYEVPVLKGALETITEYAPVLLIETHDEKDVDRIEHLLHAYEWKKIRRQNDHNEQTIMIGIHQ